MKRVFCGPFTNERGLALILAVLILTVLTVAALSGINTARLHVVSTGSDKVFKETFYVADAGLSYAMELLRADYNETGADYGWDDELAGATGYTVNTGVYRVADLPIGPNTTGNPQKTVDIIIWNNLGDPSGTPTTDLDEYIWVQVDAFDPEGIVSSISALLEGGIDNLPLDYHAQEGAGSSKHSVSQEIKAVDTTQITFPI